MLGKNCAQWVLIGYQHPASDELVLHLCIMIALVWQFSSRRDEWQWLGPDEDKMIFQQVSELHTFTLKAKAAISSLCFPECLLAVGLNLLALLSQGLWGGFFVYAICNLVQINMIIVIYLMLLVSWVNTP